MTMPGFVFHFKCDSCMKQSESYPSHVFPTLFDQRLSLPTWSTQHQFWGDIRAKLSSIQQDNLDDPKVLISLAQSLSSSALTVCVPFVRYEDDSLEPRLELFPDPVCPHCQQGCRAILGCSDRLIRPFYESVEEFDGTLIGEFPFSLGAIRVLEELGIETLGQLHSQFDKVKTHQSMKRTTLKVLRKCLERRP